MVEEPIEEENDNAANTAQTTSTAAASNSSATIRYQPRGNGEEYLSPKEVEDINRQVEVAWRECPMTSLRTSSLRHILWKSSSFDSCKRY